jgi:hypothetical protein
MTEVEIGEVDPGQALRGRHNRGRVHEFRRKHRTGETS